MPKQDNALPEVLTAAYRQFGRAVAEVVKTVPIGMRDQLFAGIASGLAGVAVEDSMDPERMAYALRGTIAQALIDAAKVRA